MTRVLGSGVRSAVWGGAWSRMLWGTEYGLESQGLVLNSNPLFSRSVSTGKILNSMNLSLLTRIWKVHSTARGTEEPVNTF